MEADRAVSVEVHPLGASGEAVQWLAEDNCPHKGALLLLTGCSGSESSRVGLWCLPANGVQFENDDGADGDNVVCVCDVPVPGTITSARCVEYGAGYAGVVSTEGGHLMRFALNFDGNEWQHEVGEAIRANNGVVTGCDISARTLQAVGVGEDGVVAVHSATNNSLFTLSCPQSLGFAGVGVSVPSAMCAAAGLGGSVFVWDLRHASPSRQHPVVVAAPRESCRLSSIAMHPSEPHVVATGAHSGHVMVWDLRRPGTTLECAMHMGRVGSVCFDPVSTTLFSSSDDGALVALHSSPPTLPLSPSHTHALASSPLPRNAVHAHPSHAVVASVGDDHGLCVVRGFVPRWVDDDE